jgi:sugar lactone lactonase YvrE
MAARAARMLPIGRALFATLLLVLLLCAHLQAQTPLLPSASAFDSAGNLYFTDANRNQVFALSPQGLLTIYAGTGTQGMSGDSGPATSATLNAPQGLAVGSDGTVYIADTGNERIRAVSGNIITTIAGTGAYGFAGDNAAALTAKLAHPTGLAVDAQGALLLCDTDNNRIRRVANGTITTIAGTSVQGFAGDGAAATAAVLNAPRGLAIDGATRVIIADTLNSRVRAIDASGTISTLAGTGIPGYTGDNGPALQARLRLPMNVVVDATGDVVIADSGNERIRLVNGAGIIVTIAGSGAQGLAADSTVAVAAALNRPLGLSLSSAGNLVFVDSGNQRIRMIAATGTLYTLVPVQSAGGTKTTLTVPAQSVYGQASVSVVIATSGPIATGNVQVLDGGSVVAQSALKNGSATIALTSLTAGAHHLQATYVGDNFNAASASTLLPLSVTPAHVIATASAASVSYGQTPPLLTGTSTGILSQDAANVSVSFSAAATSLSPAGIYPIDAMLVGLGSANYTLTSSASAGSLSILPTATSVSLQPLSAPSYAGFPLLLTASLSSITGAMPVGQVSFFDGSTLVAQTAAVNGVGSVTFTPSLTGAHTLTASFDGSQNFLASSSASLAVVTNAIPDFSITTASVNQSVQGGLIAQYVLNVLPINGTFTGTVVFSVTGLPAGASASFSPSIVVPGVSGASTTLSVQTVPRTARLTPQLSRPVLCAFGLVTFLFSFAGKRRTFRAASCFMLISCALLAAVGCGARTVGSAASPAQSSQVVVSASSTNLAGTVVTHTIALGLSVH